MENLREKTVKAMSFDMLGRFSRQGVGFVLTLILARLLNPKDFGLLAMANVVIAISSVLSDMGLSSALVQRKELSDAHYGSVFYLNFFIGIIFTVILFMSAGMIADFYEQGQIKTLIRVLSFTFIINSFCNVRRAWLRKHLQYYTLTASSVISMIFGGIIGVIMAFMGYGVWSLLAQTMVSAIVANIYIYIYTEWKPKLIFVQSSFLELWKYSAHMFLSTVVDRVYTQLDNLVIGKLFSPVILGHYFRAKSFNSLIQDYTSSSWLAVLFPVLSAVQFEKERFEKIVYRAFHLLCLVTFVSLGIFYLGSKELIIILFSAKWLPALEYYKIMALSGFVYPLSALLVNILSSKGNSKTYLRLEILKKTLFLLNMVVGFHYGILQFLYGLLFFNFIALYLNIYFAAKEMEVSPNWFLKIFWQYFFLAVFLIGSLSYINLYFTLSNSFLRLTVISTVFVSLYTGFAWLFKFQGLSIFSQEVRKLKIIRKLNDLKLKMFSR